MHNHSRSSIGQRLYDLFGAMDRVDIISHIHMIAWALHHFQRDIIDIRALAQGAPKFLAMLEALEPDPITNPRPGNRRTLPREVDEGRAQLQVLVDLQRGIVQQIATSFLHLLNEAGLNEGRDLWQVKDRLPIVPPFDETGARTYSAIYIWMAGTNGNLSLKHLADVVDCRDVQLVKDFVIPTVCLPPLQTLDDFIVCVAGSHDEALEVIAQESQEMERPNAQSILALITSLAPRYVVLLDTIQPPHVVVNWNNC